MKGESILYSILVHHSNACIFEPVETGDITGSCNWDFFFNLEHSPAGCLVYHFVIPNPYYFYAVNFMWQSSTFLFTLLHLFCFVVLDNGAAEYLNT